MRQASSEASPQEIELKHDDLAISLAKYLSKKERNPMVCWLNMKLRSGRPDVFAVCPTFNLNQCNPTTFEVKVSRADFLADVKKLKFERYKMFSKYVYFAAPYGLIKAEEIPEGCGFIEYYSNPVEVSTSICGGKSFYKYTLDIGWHYTKRACPTEGDLSLKDWVKMAFSQQKAYSESYDDVNVLT